MFVTFNQIYVFLACISFGVLSGVVYSPLIAVKERINKLPVSILIDFIYFFLLSIGYLIYSFSFNFPSFRAYMIAGVFLGIFLYLKSFRFMLAKVEKRLYNRYKKNFRFRKDN